MWPFRIKRRFDWTQCPVEAEAFDAAMSAEFLADPRPSQRSADDARAHMSA